VGEDLSGVDWEKIAARSDFQSLLRRKARFSELIVRANTGLGAEKAGAH